MSSEIKKRVAIFFSVIVVALLFLVPTVFKEEFREVNWISKPISLGLDLSGGVHLVYEVVSKEAVTSRLQVLINSIRSDLRKEKIAVTRAKVSAKNQVEITLFRKKGADKAKSLIEEEYRDLAFVDLIEENNHAKLIYGISEKQALQIEKSAISQAVETLRNRVDQFGAVDSKSWK
ncbi:hypothetical protein OAO01_09710 [Oligoflexia bacterium]|nr:hypothetical protein [Oligoflexia bacterium]